MVRQMLQKKSSRPNCFLLLVGLLFSMALVPACTAPEEEKQGYLGEFCSKDLDCRDPLICDSVRGECSEGNTPPAVSCRAICEQRANTCNSKENNCPDGNNYLCCYKSCRITVQDWSKPAIDAFESCFVNDLTCEEAISEDAPSICVSRLPLPEDRKAVCDRFESKGRTISNNTDAVDDLRLECRVLARTGPQESWADALACDDNSISNDEFVTCVNMVFEDLNPQLTNDNKPDPEPVGLTR